MPVAGQVAQAVCHAGGETTCHCESSHFGCARKCVSCSLLLCRRVCTLLPGYRHLSAGGCTSVMLSVVQAAPIGPGTWHAGICTVCCRCHTHTSGTDIKRSPLSAHLSALSTTFTYDNQLPVKRAIRRGTLGSIIPQAPYFCRAPTCASKRIYRF